MTEPVLVEPPLINHAKDFGRVIYNLFLLAIGKYPGVTGIPVVVTGGGGGDATAANQDAQTALLTTLSTNTPATVQRTATCSVETGSTNSPVAAGAKSVIFGFSSDFTGTIAGAAVNPAQFGSIPFIAPDKDTLGSIAYTVTAGSLLITKIV